MLKKGSILLFEQFQALISQFWACGKKVSKSCWNGQINVVYDFFIGKKPKRRALLPPHRRHLLRRHLPHQTLIPVQVVLRQMIPKRKNDVIRKRRRAKRKRAKNRIMNFDDPTILLLEYYYFFHFHKYNLMDSTV